ncbi:MAG: pirin family protein [Calditrichaeota bacterium]|nr:pirin family protein [Candidatus Cloacimonadota bacterium]MCA9785692.1 pirin family protein [Candidatus Cloacimonadota bacterium]MCB1046700.1 pirin family protein [Calditrichota bacterium]MCB9473760.1 pirin family protein [Candidatus Delongbacteria bacterium]
MNVTLYPAETRGHSRLAWLDSHFCFSFADWFNRDRLHYGALRVLNDDWISANSGFGTHPHDNMEIVSIGLSGELEHKDSMGHAQRITGEDVQAMSAGTGITHSEINPSPDQPCHLLQIWIIPDRKGHTPRYDQVHFPAEGRKNRLQALVSPDGTNGTLPMHQRAWVDRADLEAGLKLELPSVDEGSGLYLYLPSGELLCEGHQMRAGDALTIDGPGTSHVEALQDSQLVVIRVPLR